MSEPESTLKPSTVDLAAETAVIAGSSADSEEVDVSRSALRAQHLVADVGETGIDVDPKDSPEP